MNQSNETNPYAADETNSARMEQTSLRVRLGSTMLTLGVLLLAYGALACFVVPNLPPNGQTRLPSIYLMAAGAGLAIGGLAVRELRSRSGTQARAGTHKTISTSAGLFLLLLIVVAIFVAISLM